MFNLLIKELLFLSLIVFSFQTFINLPPSYFNIGIMFPIQKLGKPAPSIKNFAAM